MTALRNVLLAVGCVMLVSAMLAPASASTITGAQYTYTTANMSQNAVGPNGPTENAFTGAVYSPVGGGALNDGYFTTQSDIDANPSTASYYLGLGAGGDACLYYNPISVNVNLNGTYDLSRGIMAIGYVVDTSVGVESPNWVQVSINGSATPLGYIQGPFFNNSTNVDSLGDARVANINFRTSYDNYYDSVNPAALTNVQSIQLKFGANGTWQQVNEIQFATPEPSAMVLLGTGLLGLLAYAWRRRR